MPFGSRDSPHLALGLLKAVLAQAGIACDVRYLLLDFARRIDEGAYWRLANDARAYEVMAGEWVFAPALFGPEAGGPAPYLRWAQLREPGFFAECSPQLLVEAQEQAGLFLAQCLQAVDWGSYDLVGFSSSLQQNNASLALAQRVKERWPRLPIILGGANTQGEMGVELLRTFDFVDYACLSEGEALLPELVQRLVAGRPAGGIPGLAWRQGGRVQVAATSPPPVDMDSLPYPDYDDFFAQRQALFGEEEWHTNLPVETSRGCWWGERRRCTFCGASPQGTRYRQKSPARALAELEHLERRYAPRILATADDVAPRDLAPYLSALEQRQPRLRLYYMLRPEVSRAQLAQMKHAGTEVVQIGIESLSTPILRLMHKGTTALMGIQALKWCRELGIIALWNLLYGMPREDPTEYTYMAGLMPSLAHLRPPNCVIRLSLLRNSPHHGEPARYGLAHVRPAEAYHYTLPGVAEPALRRLARHFDFDYADGREVEAYAAPLVQAVAAWEKAYGDSILAYVDDGERLRIFDTRPVARRDVHALTGLERALCLACEGQQSLRRLRSRFAEREGDLQGVLDRLVDERLMVREGHVYLSLAVDVGRHFEAEARAGLPDGFCLALARALMHPRPRDGAS